MSQPQQKAKVSLALRSAAESQAARLPALRAAAQHLADAVQLGVHGRRRAGMGEDFWQFRHALPGDALRQIDWRRSARDDEHYIREREWEASQSLLLWVDPGRAMEFAGDRSNEDKATRAKVLGLALALLLDRAGERVGLLDDPEPPRRGPAQIDRLTLRLSRDAEAGDHGTPPMRQFPRGSHLVLISDFLGDPQPVADLIAAAGERGVRGALLQVLDPLEASFPFDGRTVFESMTGNLRHETLRARGIRDAYLDRLQTRQAHLRGMSDRFVWPFRTHFTDQPAQDALMWLFRAVEGPR